MKNPEISPDDDVVYVQTEMDGFTVNHVKGTGVGWCSSTIVSRESANVAADVLADFTDAKRDRERY